MAHKKGQGSSRNGRDSNSQRLGVKSHDGNVVTGGSILVRQKGRRFDPGLNVGLGKDHTLFPKIDGKVRFEDHGKQGDKLPVIPVKYFFLRAGRKPRLYVAGRRRGRPSGRPTSYTDTDVRRRGGHPRQRRQRWQW